LAQALIVGSANLANLHESTRISVRDLRDVLVARDELFVKIRLIRWIRDANEQRPFNFSTLD
jgi:hypothetical protein